MMFSLNAIERFRFSYFLVGWTILNLIQAGLSPLDPDEAYYWQYAQSLAWGYFDHPPLVALSIAMGSSWLPGTLGLRLGHVLLSTLTLAGIWDLLERPRGHLAALLSLILLAQPVFNLYGFIATPDGPLLFGTVAFWWCYRRFRAEPSWGNTVLWAVAMALLLYAKYHGILIILLTVLADWRLWRQPRYYVAGLLGVLLFLPHLAWQYAHDFPTFRYHLSGRNDEYESRFTLEFLLSQFFLFNPLLWWYYVRLRYHNRDRFTRVLWLSMIGVALFFLWNTFKGPAEPHWTAVLAIPLSILLFRHLRERPQWGRGVVRLAGCGAVLLLIARLWLMLPVDWLPRELHPQFNHRWTYAVADYAGDLPVVFENSYRQASIYAFYTGKPAWTYTNTHYRPNQYDLWDTDTSLHEQTIIMAGHLDWACGTLCDTIAVLPQQIAVARIENFQLSKRMQFAILTELPTRVGRGDSLQLHLRWTNPYNHSITPAAGSLPLHLYAITRNGREPWIYWPVEWPDRPARFPPRSSGEFKVDLRLPAALHEGPAELRFGWAYGNLPPVREQGEVASFIVE